MRAKNLAFPVACEDEILRYPPEHDIRHSFGSRGNALWRASFPIGEMAVFRVQNEILSLLIAVFRYAALEIDPTNLGGDMAEETAEQKLARLEAENRALKEQIDQRKPAELRLKISEKGGLSVYGLGRFPVTLYKEQWTRLLDHVDEIKTFLQEHDRDLKAKQ
jgi:hypothetical protein